MGGLVFRHHRTILLGYYLHPPNKNACYNPSSRSYTPSSCRRTEDYVHRHHTMAWRLWCTQQESRSGIWDQQLIVLFIDRARCLFADTAAVGHLCTYLLCLICRLYGPASYRERIAECSVLRMHSQCTLYTVATGRNLYEGQTGNRGVTLPSG